MREDEQWVTDLVERSRGLVPDVPVDVASALRGGRRRRTQRRAIGGGALVAVMVGAGLGIPALPRPTTVPGVVETAAPTPTGDLPYAEIVDAIPGCPLGAVVPETTPEWQRIGDGRAPGGPLAGLVDASVVLGLQEPTPGAVPPDFEPVAAVTCRDATPPGSPIVVEAPVLLAGDLGPLLDFLAQPEPVVGRDPQCVMDYWLGPPELYLVDAAGRVIAPHWPTDPCGRAAEDGLALLDALDGVAIWAESSALPYAQIIDADDPCDDDWALGQYGADVVGPIPPGFEPVAVVTCPVYAVDPESPTAEPTHGERLEGDLGPLLAFLADPPEFSEPVGCLAVGHLVGATYFVDADGRAVPWAWPRDACGEPLDEVQQLLDALAVVGPVN